MYDVRWVHAFEEDAPGVLAYRPATGDVPLSRRPRDGFELHRNGTAQIFSGGPDDRAVARDATWKESADGVIDISGANGEAFRIVKRTQERLFVRRDR